jgi:hypothetical protein
MVRMPDIMHPHEIESDLCRRMTQHSLHCVHAYPNNYARADLRDFVPLDYDPEHFDVAETDVDMRSERPLEGF